MAQKGRISEILGTTVALGLFVHKLRKSPAATAQPATEPDNHTGAHDDSQTARPDAAATPPHRPDPPPPNASLLRIVKSAFGRFMDDDCMTQAAALAYYTTFSLAPLLLIVISIVGFIFGRQAVQHEIQTQIEGLIGSGAASQVGAMVQNAGRHASTGILGAALGILALLFGATGALTQLQTSLNNVWRVKPDPNAGGVKIFIWQRILSFGMILAIAFLLVVSLAVSAALSAFGNFLAYFLPSAFSGPLLHAIWIAISMAIIAALFASMFKFLPDAAIQWHHVWIGAAITSVLFTIGKFLIGLYLGHSGMASTYGAAGSLVLIVLWIYYSALVFLFGAEITELWQEKRAGSVHPKPGAVRVADRETASPQRAA